MKLSKIWVTTITRSVEKILAAKQISQPWVMDVTEILESLLCVKWVQNWIVKKSYKLNYKENNIQEVSQTKEEEHRIKKESIGYIKRAKAIVEAIIEEHRT